MSTLRDRLVRLLRVPAQPELPASDPAAVRVFHPASGYLRYRRLSWLLKQAGALLGLISGLFLLRSVNFLPPRVQIGPLVLSGGVLEWLLVLVEVGAWVGFVTQAAGSLLLLRFDGEQRWYLISDRSLRVREGLFRMREKTTTFANIQNVSIRQGPLQRWFGISDLEVRSAGGGESDEEGSDKLHTVWFRGVTDADAIRDTLLRRVEASRDGGLGDAEAEAPKISSADRLADAARALLEETRALRSAARPGG